MFEKPRHQFSPEEIRWMRALLWHDGAYSGIATNLHDMARYTKLTPREILQGMARLRRAKCLQIKPQRYPPRLVAGVYYENGLLFRELMVEIYAAA